MGNEMGNNNTSALKEEDNTSEAEKKFLGKHVYEDGVNEQSQIITTAKGSDADPKAAGLACDGTSELGNVRVREDSDPNSVKGENQPTVEAKDVMEKAEKASDDITVELGRDTLHEDSRGDQTSSAAEAEDAKMKPIELASEKTTSRLENESSEGDKLGDDVNVENQMYPAAEAEEDQEKATGMASDNIESTLGKESMEEDTHQKFLIEENQLNERAEDVDIEEKSAEEATYNAANTLEKDPLEQGENDIDVNVEHQFNPGTVSSALDSKACELKEDIHANEKQGENNMPSIAKGTDVEENASDLASSDPVNAKDFFGYAEEDITEVRQQDKSPSAGISESRSENENSETFSRPEFEGTEEYERRKDSSLKKNDLLRNDCHLDKESSINDPVNVKDFFGYAEEDITEVRQDKSPSAGTIESRSENENSETFSRPEFEGTEEYERQKDSSLKKNDLLRNDCHLDKESSIKQEEQDTTLSNEAKFQESSDMHSNHDECAKIFPEPLIHGVESQKRTDFLDTNLHCQKDEDDVLEKNMEFQEKMLCTDKSDGRDGGEFVNGLRDKSGVTSDSPNVGSKTNGASVTKVNCITDDSLILLHESAIAKITPDHKEKSRTGPEMESSHDYNPGHSSQVPLNEFKDDVTNGNFYEERNTVCTFNAYVHINRNQVEEAKETENGHQLDECVNNHKKASDEISKDFVVPEAEADPLIAESTVADCRYGEDVNKMKIVEEMEKNPEASYLTVKSKEAREMSEEFNPNLVTLDQEESLTMDISSSLIHIDNFQPENVNQNRTFIATIMPNWHLKQANDNKSSSALVDKKDTSNLSVPTLDSVDDEALEKEGEDCSQQTDATSNMSGETYPDISPIANAGCEGMESITRLSTESNPDISIISSQMQKSPSFNINLRMEAWSEESGQTPLLSQEKTTSESLSNQTSHSNINSTFHAEYDQCMIKNEEVEIEEKVVTMERSYSEKPKAPFLSLLKEEEEAHLLVTPQKQRNNGGGTKKAVKVEASTSAKGEEKRKPKPSFFSSCMCCATVMN